MKTKTESTHTPMPSCLAKECQKCWPIIEWAEEDQILIINGKTYSKCEIFRAVNEYDEDKKTIKALLEAVKEAKIFSATIKQIDGPVKAGSKNGFKWSSTQEWAERIELQMKEAIARVDAKGTIEQHGGK